LPRLLAVCSEFDWEPINRLATNHDGRASSQLWPDHLPFEAGVYRIVFDTQAYFEKSGRTTFYPYVEVVFRIADPTQHYHVPLLISPYGYSTYRGS
jgi:5-hydroxyisourate hydrolase